MPQRVIALTRLTSSGPSSRLIAARTSPKVTFSQRHSVTESRKAAICALGQAKARAKRYPAAAEQLRRFADAAVARVEAIKCGPLFDTEKG